MIAREGHFSLIVPDFAVRIVPQAYSDDLIECADAVCLQQITELFQLGCELAVVPQQGAVIGAVDLIANDETAFVDVLGITLR